METERAGGGVFSVVFESGIPIFKGRVESDLADSHIHIHNIWMPCMDVSLLLLGISPGKEHEHTDAKLLPPIGAYRYCIQPLFTWSLSNVNGGDILMQRRTTRQHIALKLSRGMKSGMDSSLSPVVVPSPRHTLSPAPGIAIPRSTF